MFGYVPVQKSLLKDGWGLLADDAGLGLSRSAEVFTNNFIPLHQHLADECTNVFKFVWVNIHVVFVFD